MGKNDYGSYWDDVGDAATNVAAIATKLRDLRTSILTDMVHR